MVLMSRRQAEVLEELREWRENVGGGIGSRVILLAVSAGWGRSAVLARFRESVDDLAEPAAAGLTCQLVSAGHITLTIDSSSKLAMRALTALSRGRSSS